MGAIKFVEGRYPVSLPWKEFHDPLPDNYQLSVIQLRGLLYRLKQHPIILKEYDHVVQDQLEKGIVEAVPATRLCPGPLTTYLTTPSYMKISVRDKSTTKVRVVYDASAKGVKGLSLNDCLQKGPKFNQAAYI